MGESNPFKQPVVTFHQLYKRFENNQHDPLMGMLYAAILAFPIAIVVALFIMFIIVTFFENPQQNTLGLFVVFLIVGAGFILTSPVLLLWFLYVIPYLTILPIAAALATSGLIGLGYRLPKVFLFIWVAAWTATFCIAISMDPIPA